MSLSTGLTGPAYTYLWSTTETSASINVSATASISVIVSDAGGCQGFDTVQVTVNPNPVAVLKDSAICADAPPVVFDAGAGYTYKWSDLGSGTAQTFSANAQGDYTVEIVPQTTGFVLSASSGSLLNTLTVKKDLVVAPGVYNILIELK